jgi:hypothetical protein
MTDNPPPQYGAPGTGYGSPRQTDSVAVAALVTAIAGFFICAPVGGIAAILLASNARKRIEASGGQLGGLELARAARILGIIQLVLSAVAIIASIIVVIVLVATSNGTDETVGASVIAMLG